MSAPVTIPNRPAGTDTRSIAAILADFDAVLNELNGNIDNTHVKVGAAIALSKLANGSSAQVPIGDASGVWTPRSLSGDVTVGNTGVTVIGAGKVTGAMLNASAVSHYRQLLTADGYLGNGAAGDKYPLGSINLDLDGMQPDPHQKAMAGSDTFIAFPQLWFAAADHAISGLTTKLFLRAQVETNATAPGITFTFGLYPMTLSGGNNIIIHTLGTLVPGSSVAIASPGVNGTTQASSGDFAIPSDAKYCLAVESSAVMPTNSVVSCHAQLYVRNVA
jgi:hypothetical protein